jgi:outer membrane protein
MKTLSKGLISALVLCGLSLPASAQTRMATVSMQKVFENYWKTKQGDAVLKDQVAEIEKSNKQLVDDWKKGKEEWQKLLDSANDQAVSAAERDKRKKAAEDKLTDLKRMEENITSFQRQATTRLNEQKAQMRKRILDEIK